MLSDLLLLLTLALLAVLGSTIARRALGIGSALGYALGLPLALFVLLFLALTSVHLGSIPLWGNLLGAVVVLLALVAVRPTKAADDGELDPPFSRALKISLGILLGVVLFYLHSHQLMETESDFYLHYPETQQFHRQNAAPRNPFFPDYPLQGHFGKHLMLATFSVVVDGDVQRAQWLAELAIVTNSLLLWCFFLRRISGSPRGAVVGTWLVFTGVNVGSRIGLMTTFDTNNGLVYLLLPAVLVVYWELLRRPTPRLAVAAGLLTGVHGAVYETNCVVAVGCLISTAVVARLWGQQQGKIRALAIAAVILMGSVLTCLQGGIISSLAQRSLDQQPKAAKALEEQNVSLEVSVRFPKPEFLQIRLGSEPYQRLSASFDTKPMRDLRPALDSGGYAFIFGPKVLLLHWLPTWLAPLTMIWAWRRRRLDGAFLASYGAIAFVIPGLFNFGPLFEGEYFRWQFSAGLAFAGLLGIAIGELWSPRKPAIVAATCAILLVNGLAAEKAINDIFKRFHQDPAAAGRALTFWYPRTGDWFVSQEEADLTPDDLEATAWLRANAEPGDRVLTDFRSEGHDSMIREGIIGGLSATYTVGHELPTSWTPYATAPYLPSSATQAFRQTFDPDLASGIGVRWLYLDPAQGAFTGLQPVFTSKSGKRAIYKLTPAGQPTTPLQLPEAITAVELQTSALPAADASQSGVAYPVTLTLSESLQGWVTPALLGKEGRLLNRLSPLTTKIQGKTCEALVVPPLTEGPYQVQWLYAKVGGSWTKIGEPREGAYEFTPTVEQRLRTTRADASGVVIENISSRPFDTGGLVKLSWRLWDLERQEYRLRVPEGSKDIALVLAPGEKTTIGVDVPVPAEGQVRVDYFLSAQVGPLVELKAKSPAP